MLKFGCGTVNMTLIAVSRFSWPVTCAPQKVHGRDIAGYRKNHLLGNGAAMEIDP